MHSLCNLHWGQRDAPCWQQLLQNAVIEMTERANQDIVNENTCLAYLKHLIRHRRASMYVIVSIYEDLRLNNGDQITCLHQASRSTYFVRQFKGLQKAPRSASIKVLIHI